MLHDQEFKVVMQNNRVQTVKYYYFIKKEINLIKLGYQFSVIVLYSMKGNKIVSLCQ